MSTPRSWGPDPLVIAIGLAAIVNPLNGTMIAVGFQAIAHDFDRSLADASWLVTLFLAVTATLQPLAGALGDRIGRRAVFLTGIVSFAVASTCAALSSSFEALVAFRCLQAASSSLVIPNGQAMLRDAVPPERRGRAIGWLGSILSLGASIGLPLGGLIVSTMSWRSLFWVNLPIAAVALAFALRVLPRTAGARQGEGLSPLAASGLALLPLGIGVQLVAREASRGLGIAALVTAALLLGGATLVVARSTRGRADAAGLASRGFVVALLATLLQNVAFYACMVTLPAWIASALEIPTGAAGVVLGAMTFLMMAVAPVSGGLADRVGVRAPALIGLACGTLGLATLAFVVPATAAPVARAVAVGAGVLLLGAGFGLPMPALQRSALDAAPAATAGLAMGLIASARFGGGILGSGVLAAAFGEATHVPVAHGAEILGLLIVVGPLPAFALAWLLPPPRRMRT